MRIRTLRSESEIKNEFSALGILKKLSSKEPFDIDGYFKPIEKHNATLPRIKNVKIKTKQKDFYEPWEISESDKYKRSFRARHREVIDKIKMKQPLVAPMNFKLSKDLQQRINSSVSLKTLNSKFIQ